MLRPSVDTFAEGAPPPPQAGFEPQNDYFIDDIFRDHSGSNSSAADFNPGKDDDQKKDKQVLHRERTANQILCRLGLQPLGCEDDEDDDECEVVHPDGTLNERAFAQLQRFRCDRDEFVTQLLSLRQLVKDNRAKIRIDNRAADNTQTSSTSADHVSMNDEDEDEEPHFFTESFGLSDSSEDEKTNIVVR